MCCTRLAENTGCKNSPKIRYLHTIAQLCQAISSQLRHVSTIGKKIVQQQYLLQYGSLGVLYITMPIYGNLSNRCWDMTTFWYSKLVQCGTDGRLLLSGFQVLLTLTLTLDRVDHRPLSTYQISLKSEKLFSGRTNRRDPAKYNVTWHKKVGQISKIWPEII